MATSGSGHREFDRSMKNRMTASLPDHLIVEYILPILPVKSLIRFKTVCKFWLSIISSSEFQQSHFKFSSLRPRFVILNKDPCLEQQFKLQLLPCDKNDNVGDLARLDLDQNWVFTSLDIAGSCNGLLCLYLKVGKMYGNFCVWNPATHQCRKIENPEGEDLVSDCGFGYASSIDDYKILALFWRPENGYGDLYVFSLRTGEWKGIAEFCGFYAYALRLDNFRIFVINDTLYWPDKSLGDWRATKYILGVDLVDDKLKEIPWIDHFSQYKGGDFFVMKGCVSLYCEGDRGSDVWVLKQFGDENSWEKLFSVNLGGMSFLNFTEKGECLAKSPGQLKVIDPSQESPDDSQVAARFSGEIGSTDIYFESFISPFVNQL
ncbi:F-box/kelch-repeat protein At3g23880-like [Silene latifolia]|uniref:F-box/kelch-repeat protein At3g23880-like n=1 Tax=Silene latifolia TaxID=37657 RepID=UPI003D789357